MVWKHLYKIIYQGFQENILNLNVTIFVFGLGYLVTSDFVVHYIFYQQFFNKQKIFEKYLMNVIHKFSATFFGNETCAV